MVRIELLQGEPLRTVWGWECDNLPDWTEEEFVATHSAHPWVCWGVYANGELAACFSMEQQPDRSIAVHVSSNRLLPFNILKKIAKGCADGLLASGVPYLSASAPNDKRAAIWLAKAAGFQEVNRTETMVELVRHGHENEANSKSVSK